MSGYELNKSAVNIGRDNVQQEENTEECDLYDDVLSEEQFYELFGDSDNE